MFWFSANLLFRAKTNGIESDNDLWEERIIIVNANTEQDAKNECIKIGKSEEHEYFVNSDSNILLRWSFVQVERIYRIKETVFTNGTEIFSRFLRNSEVVSLLTPFDEN